jgi:arabinogalactan endo-1,4-beta-galactosidase
MEVLLDFYYSDDWADPNKQEIPKAWLPIVDNLEVLGDSIYNYTFKTLEKLEEKKLTSRNGASWKRNQYYDFAKRNKACRNELV